jgi:hypothetical protein
VREPSAWRTPVKTPTVANVSSYVRRGTSFVRRLKRNRHKSKVHYCASFVVATVFLCTSQTTWLNDKHVVFGKVISGQDVVSAIEQVGSDSGRTRVQGMSVLGCCTWRSLCSSYFLSSLSLHHSGHCRLRPAEMKNYIVPVSPHERVHASVWAYMAKLL